MEPTIQTEHKKKIPSVKREIFHGLLVVFFALPFLSMMGSSIAIESLRKADSSLLEYMVLMGPRSMLGVALLLYWLLCIGWFQIVLAIMVYKRVKKFKEKGIDTTPILWGLSVFLPSVVIALPLYFVRTRITWPPILLNDPDGVGFRGGTYVKDKKILTWAIATFFLFAGAWILI